MANTLSNTGIVTGQTVEALQVSQSVDAFTGANDYDITISGSLTLTGSLLQTGSVYFKQIADSPATPIGECASLCTEIKSWNRAGVCRWFNRHRSAALTITGTATVTAFRLRLHSVTARAVGVIGHYDRSSCPR